MLIYACFKMKRLLISIYFIVLCVYVWGGELLSGTSLSGDGWRGLDLGQPYVITQVGWKPTSTTTAELGMFEGANSPDFMDALPLYMHDGASQANQMNYAEVNCSRGFRYVRYRKSDNKGEYKISSLEFYGDSGEGDDSHLAQLTNLPTVVIHTQDNVAPYDKEHEIKDLVLDETYTLEEEVPVGYEAADALKFKVDKDGNILKLNEDGSTTPIGEDGIFPVNIVPTEISFQINKVDAGTGEEVEGAVLTVIESGEDGKETVLERWTSKKGETHDFGSKLERGKQYLLREVTAPAGYGKLTTDIAISVNEDGTIKTALAKTKDKDGNDVYLVENTKISVKISKVDITSGTELEGAKIRIIGEDGKVIEEWTSTKAVHEVFGLEPGVKYTLNETVAPKGYALTADTTFVLKEDGSIDTTKTTTTVKDGVLLVQDKVFSFKVRKQDEAGKLLGGAKLKISYRNNKEIVSWTTEANKEKTITGLGAGKYYLYEVQAPAGYQIAKRIEFEIDEYGRIIRDKKVVPSLIMVDKKTSTNQPQKRATVTPRPANSTNVSKKSTTGSTTTAKAKTTGAKTGDNSPIMLYIILLVAAGAVIVVIKRRSQSNK